MPAPSCRRSAQSYHCGIARRDCLRLVDIGENAAIFHPSLAIASWRFFDGVAECIFPHDQRVLSRSADVSQLFLEIASQALRIKRTIRRPHDGEHSIAIFAVAESAPSHKVTSTQSPPPQWRGCLQELIPFVKH